MAKKNQTSNGEPRPAAKEVPSPYSAKEVREKLYAHMRSLCRECSNSELGQTEVERMEALCFLLLNVFDGTVGAFPAMDIHLAPHSADKHFCVENRERWYDPGMVINECYMHKEWYSAKTSGDLPVLVVGKAVSSRSLVDEGSECGAAETRMDSHFEASKRYSVPAPLFEKLLQIACDRINPSGEKHHGVPPVGNSEIHKAIRDAGEILDSFEAGC